MGSNDRNRRLILIFLSWIAAVSLAAPANAAITYLVNSTLDQLDVDPGDGVCQTLENTCTLRAAVMEANREFSNAVTIALPSGTYTLTRQVTGLDDEQNGDLDFLTPAPAGNAAITLQGAGAATTIIDANNVDRIIQVAGYRAVIVEAVTLRKGATLSVGGGFLVEALGVLEINDCVVTLNSSGYEPLGVVGVGGGGWIDGSLKVRRSEIRENEAQYEGAGGGLYVTSAGTVSILQSTLAQNISRVGGGLQLSAGATATIAQTAIVDNSSVTGGGLRSFGNLIIINSTISGNSAGGSGGGIYAGDSSTSNIYNSTIAFNSADDDYDNNGSGGGVFVTPGSVAFNIRGTIIAGSSTGFLGIFDDCAGVVRTYAQNRFGSANGCTITPVTGTWGLLNGLSTLGPLQDNGGPTQTIALLPGSNAIDAATSGCVDQNSTILPTDQRGFPRFVGICDVGAFEFGSGDPNDALFENGFE